MNTWGNFLFALIVRFVGGVIIGVIASIVLGQRIILSEFSHDTMWTVVFRLGIWGLGGGIICAFTTPSYTWPWRNRRD